MLVDFSKAFDSILREMTEQTLVAYGLFKVTITAILMLYKNMKAMVYSPNGDTDFFDIVTGAWQGDTFVLLLFIICLDYALWISIDLMKENGFMLKKPRKRQHPTETMMDINYADDLAIFANTPTQTKSLLYYLIWFLCLRAYQPLWVI